MAQDVRQLVDVLDRVFEGLDLGQRLSSPAVIRRQVIPELVESLGQAPHPHLLPLAGLHAPLGGHLGLVEPLRPPALLEAVGGEVLEAAGEAHLRGGTRGGPRGSGLEQIVLLRRFPFRHDFGCDQLQIHGRRGGKKLSRTSSLHGFYTEAHLRRFMGCFTAQARSSKKTSSAKMRPSLGCE